MLDLIPCYADSLSALMKIRSLEHAEWLNLIYYHFNLSNIFDVIWEKSLSTDISFPDCQPTLTSAKHKVKHLHQDYVQYASIYGKMFC